MQQSGGITFVTSEEMKVIDAAAIEAYGISVFSLMENAGLATAILSKQMLGDGLRGRRIACLTGKGNNGGDGLVASRHLHNWGAEVTIVLGSGREVLGETCSLQLVSAEAMGIPILGPTASLAGFDLLVDALLGYNSKGDPREPVAGLIRRANDSDVPIIAVDIPSGLDPTTGTPNDPCIAAKATLTLAFPKTGFLNQASRKFVGELYLGDVSIPVRVYEEYRQNVPLFDAGQVVRIW
ncbi:MAG TPA: NAD(P)H-hydrate epimerase [Nitrososphaerales archaeon]|nr:NAD(P)H-hydrate epimerase [Nitrososphaerales archaeon]